MKIYQRLAVITALCMLLSGCASKDMILSNQGFEALSRKDYVDAEKCLEESLALNPYNPYALLNMGVVYEKTGRPRQALAMYHKVIALGAKEEVVKSNNQAAQGSTLTDLARANMKHLQQEIANSTPVIEEPVHEEPLTPPEISSTPAAPKLKEPIQEVAEKKKTDQDTSPPPPPPAPTTTTIPIVGEKAPLPSEREKIEAKGTFYSIQVASYKNAEYAAARVKELKHWGFDAFQQQVEIKNGLYHRIFIGSFKTKQEALEKAEALKELRIITDYLIRLIKG